MSFHTFGKLTIGEILDANDGHEENKKVDFDYYRILTTTMVNVWSGKGLQPEEVIKLKGDKTSPNKLDQSTAEGREKIKNIIEERFGTTKE